jgi:hypothetical protein
LGGRCAIHPNGFWRGRGFPVHEAIDQRAIGVITVEIAGAANVSNGTLETISTLLVSSSGCANFRTASITSGIGNSRRSAKILATSR